MNPVNGTIPEQVVEELNNLCAEQTEAQPIILTPFRYISTGDNWRIDFFESAVASDDEEGRLEKDELKAFVLDDARKTLESIKKLRL